MGPSTTTVFATTNKICTTFVTELVATSARHVMTHIFSLDTVAALFTYPKQTLSLHLFYIVPFFGSCLVSLFCFVLLTCLTKM